MKMLLICLVSLSCFAQDKEHTSLVFTNKVDLLKWNTYQLPLGTNTTQRLYEVTKTNDFVVLIPTNQISKLVQDGRITDNGGKIDPINPKADAIK